MRMLLVVAILAIPAPALAIDMEAYRAARNKEASAAVDRENGRRKALCDRLGGVRVGLTADGVLKSCWGKPERRNVTTTAAGDREQWVYDAGYVYLTNGVVTAIQTSR